MADNPGKAIEPSWETESWEKEGKVTSDWIKQGEKDISKKMKLTEESEFLLFPIDNWKWSIGKTCGSFEPNGRCVCRVMDTSQNWSHTIL